MWVLSLWRWHGSPDRYANGLGFVFSVEPLFYRTEGGSSRRPAVRSRTAPGTKPSAKNPSTPYAEGTRSRGYAPRGGNQNHESTSRGNQTPSTAIFPRFLTAVDTTSTSITNRTHTAMRSAERSPPIIATSSSDSLPKASCRSSPPKPPRGPGDPLARGSAPSGPAWPPPNRWSLSPCGIRSRSFSRLPPKPQSS